jgi:PAS domain S-box-containing protein
MRDQHRPKQDLIGEVVALRKQVADLQDARAARQRVEGALRYSEEQLRMLVDGAPVGLCLFRSDGELAAANRPFARMLGYDSAAELLSVAGVLGVFASREEQARLVQNLTEAEEFCGEARFRRKSGRPLPSWAMGSVHPEDGGIALAVLENFRAASPGGTRSASDRYDA